MLSLFFVSDAPKANPTVNQRLYEIKCLFMTTTVTDMDSVAHQLSAERALKQRLDKSNLSDSLADDGEPGKKGDGILGPMPRDLPAIKRAEPSKMIHIPKLPLGGRRNDR